MVSNGRAIRLRSFELNTNTTPSAQTPTNLTDLPFDVLKIVADNLQNGFSAGSLASVNETSKKLYEASKHALWEVVHWDEKSFGAVDLAEEAPATVEEHQVSQSMIYVYFTKSAEKDYFWTKLNQVAPEHKTRYDLAYHFFPNFQAVVETSKGKDTPWPAYISPRADYQTVLAELIKLAYRINSDEFANVPIQDHLQSSCSRV
ncbi:hypothetical protein QFC22_004769 [Naganishia vaughanmartiniae]|uniref:Uncharacterized protein n=1 Tax=Naganishia vaughanmartiniae TaxID=1424756 RepID=A0ACC2WYT5_9TREE|nr:hypothetical protein QFC22_004769 [Naganishia vaughanmartiniae]